MQRIVGRIHSQMCAPYFLNVRGWKNRLGFSTEYTILWHYCCIYVVINSNAKNSFRHGRIPHIVNDGTSYKWLNKRQDDRGIAVWFLAGARDSLRLQSDQTGSGAYIASFSGERVTGGSFSRVKRLGHEVDHLLPSSAEVKNEWSSTLSLPRLHGFHWNVFNL